MKNLERIAVESAGALDIPGLEEARPYIKPDSIARLTDEDLITQASSETSAYITWDNIADFGYGVPEADLPLNAWRKRFDYEFEQTIRESGDRIAEPGAFVEALLCSQRTLPTVGEYAEVLGAQRLLRKDEVDTAKVVSVLEDADFHARSKQIEQMDEDERWQYKTVRGKLEYYINLSPDSDVALGEAKRQAEAYATKQDAHRHGKLLEARGLSPKEIKEVVSTDISDRFPLHYRSKGVDPSLAVDMAENAGGPILKDWQNPVLMVDKALSGNLNTQLAVRQYLGISNLYELLNYQAKIDRMYDERKELAYKFAGAGLAGAVLDVDPEVVKPVNSPMDLKVEGSTFNEPVLQADESERFASLAGFVIHEPALRPFLHHTVTNELLARYQTWIEADTES